MTTNFTNTPIRGGIEGRIITPRALGKYVNKVPGGYAPHIDTLLDGTNAVGNPQLVAGKERSIKKSGMSTVPIAIQYDNTECCKFALVEAIIQLRPDRDGGRNSVQIDGYQGKYGKDFLFVGIPKNVKNWFWRSFPGMMTNGDKDAETDHYYYLSMSVKDDKIKLQFEGQEVSLADFMDRANNDPDAGLAGKSVFGVVGVSFMLKHPAGSTKYELGATVKLVHYEGLTNEAPPPLNEKMTADLSGLSKRLVNPDEKFARSSATIAASDSSSSSSSSSATTSSSSSSGSGAPATGYGRNNVNLAAMIAANKAAASSSSSQTTNPTSHATNAPKGEQNEDKEDEDDQA